MPLDLDSCIAGVFTPGNIGASSGQTPVVRTVPTFYNLAAGDGSAAGIGAATATGSAETGALAVGTASGVGAAAGVSPVAAWTPADLGSNLLIWLKGDDLAGSDGDNIAAWNDASGNARHFTQSTEADKPSLEVAELNSLNVVRFAQTNTEELAGPSLSGIATAATLFLVVKGLTDPGGGTEGGPCFFGTDGTQSNHYPFSDGNVYNGDLKTSRHGLGNPGVSLAAWRIIGITSASADWKYYIDGVQFYTTASNTVGLSTSPRLGRGFTSGSTYWSGDMAEVILSNTALGTSDRQKAEGYLAHKWFGSGASNNLDSGHPYKNTPP